MTFEEALGIAKQNSPEIQQARFALERSQENLNAQEAQDFESTFKNISLLATTANSLSHNPFLRLYNQQKLLKLTLF